MRNGKFEMENGRKSFVLGIALLIAAVAFTLSACTVYDNYDIELMEAETADVSGDDPADLSSSSESKEVDEKSSSSKNGKDTSYIIIVNPNSSESSASVDDNSSSSKAKSSASSWVCGDSTVIRDGVVYETVLYSELCVMRKNMQYKSKQGSTWCYSDEDHLDGSANCEKFGLLYDYKAATGACPSGWRLPTKKEIEKLTTYYKDDDETTIGKHFKATEGWDGEGGIEADDELKFTALPGGLCDDEQVCSGYGYVGYWWTSTESSDWGHYTLQLWDDNDQVMFIGFDNNQYASVRCVKEYP